VTGWWARLSLRARLLTVGLLGLAVAQAVGSVGLYVALSVASRHDLDRRAEATAQQVADLVTSGRLPDPIPVTGSESVQVVDSRGRVLSASANGDRLTALLTPAELARARSSPVTVPGSRLGMGSSLRVTATPVSSAGDAPVVVVAEPVAEVARSQHLLVVILLVSYPLLLVVLGLIAYRVIGLALGPVESLRAAAERVSGAGRDERLPEPASRDEIHALAVTLNSMLGRLAAARDRERSFVADVAHELRSPLASLRVQVDVARRHGASDADLADLGTEVDRLSVLVEDLLGLARLDAGEPLPDPEPPASPVEVLGSFADDGGDPDDAGGRRVTGALGPVADGTLPMTRLELERVVGNLVDNARRHARSRVDLGFRRTPESAVLSVGDDGAGVPASERERVFDRFARLDEARDRDTGGTGLGLAIARALVRHRGGDLVLADSPTGGLLAQVVFGSSAPRAARAPSQADDPPG
jgi:signal transduction histidine kinase